MHLSDIVTEIGGLRLYDAQEWEEYISFFEEADTLRGGLQVAAPAEEGELVRRICRGEGNRADVANVEALPKITTVADLTRKDIRTSMTLGVVSGAFDLLHLGHLRAIREAKESLAGRSNGILCAMTLSDQHIRDKKGPGRPVLNLRERIEIIAAVRYVDYVMPLQEPNCLAAIDHLRPDFFFKSDEDSARGIVCSELDLVRALGGRVIRMSSCGPRRRSTTSMVEAIKRRLGDTAGSSTVAEDPTRRQPV